MPNEFILLFASIMDLAIVEVNLANNPIIHFGIGSNMFKVINSLTLTSLEKERQLAKLSFPHAATTFSCLALKSIVQNLYTSTAFIPTISITKYI